MNPVLILQWAATAIELADRIKRMVETGHQAGEITDEQMAEAFGRSAEVDTAWDARIAAAKARIAGTDEG